MAHNEIMTINGVEMNVRAFDRTAQEIDDAAGVVPTLVRPNLLDNWHFGRAVDQRNGYISLYGVTVYNDEACTSVMGIQGEQAMLCIKSGNNYQRRYNNTNAGYVKAADVVRGYTGNGYGIDRWRGWVDSSTLLVKDGGVEMFGDWILQIFEKNSIPENVPLTLSVLTRGGLNNLSFYSEAIDRDGVPNGLDLSTDMITVTTTLPTGFTNNCRLALMGKKNALIIAAKLELGPTQTLAHQEDGKWVLNEVPEYGEELRRCQRYFRALKIQSIYTLAQSAFISNDGKDIVTEFPFGFRTIPVVSIAGNGLIIRGTDGYVVQNYFPAVKVIVIANGITTVVFMKHDNTAWGAKNNTPIIVSAASDTTITFSADL